MARGRGRRSSQMGRAISVGSLPSVTPLLSPPSPLSLSDIEDGRIWHPDPERGAVTFGGRYARVVVHRRPIVARSQAFARWGFPRGLPVGLQVPVGVQFHHPFNVLTCVRRKIRRQVIFARQKAGKGVKRNRPRRTWRSAIWC